MYKDKDKQREANRLASKRYRERKGMTLDAVNTVIPIPTPTNTVIPDVIPKAVPTLQPMVQQSYNSMMKGYVPPKG